MTTADDSGRSLFVNAQDGLRLHAREYGSRDAPGLPVVCLPGLTRTVADFEALAPALAHRAGRGRRVVAIDSRGRGQSEYDSNPDNYNLAVELTDIVTVLTALGIGPAVFVGSSRGGLITMLLGRTHPALIAGVVLHDIGPVLEPQGLTRIKGYVGKLPQPRDFADAAEILARLFGAHFPKFTPAQWLTAARRAWQTTDDGLIPTYDVRLAPTLADVDTTQPLPPLWDEFDAFGRVPILVIRGTNSDLLSAATVAAMAARHPGLRVIEVPDQGHVPALDGDLVVKVADFVAACDATASRQ
jgi:pimeloyl-ACP methyl ester carboxylesterase